MFFKTALVILEDEKAIELSKTRKYSSIVVLSYNKLELPGFVSYSKPTLLIDLSRPADEIFQTFNDTTRNEIRRTQRDNLLSFKVSDGPDRQSYDLYKGFEYAQGRVPVPLASLSNMAFIGAYLGGEMISGIYITRSRPYLRLRSIFSKRLDAKDKGLYRTIGYATRRLVWEACLWGKNNGYATLDMASVNINNPKTL